MLTKFDEYPYHQIVSTFDHVNTSERNWTEKTYLSAFDTSGRMIVSAGFGKYPNRNVMDAYGGVALNGRQYTVRASRELHPDVDTVAVGPISYEVVEPLQKIHVRLGENDYGVGFDVEFDGYLPAWEEPIGFTRLRGALVNNTCRYYQLGRASGKLTVEGRTHDINPDTWYANRDRSWGVRRMAGVPQANSWWFEEGLATPEEGLQPLPPTPGILASLFMLQFKGYGMVFTYHEMPDGRAIPPGTGTIGGCIIYPSETKKPPSKIIDSQLEWEFLPGTRRVKSVRAVIRTQDNLKKEISVKPSGPVFYLRAGGYFGFKDWWHGKWMGPCAIDGERLDLTDEKMISRLHGVDDVVCECRCDGDAGYGIIEPLPIGTLPKYGLTV